MGTFRSADESKSNCVAVMGEPLGILYNALWQDVAWLYREWQEYVMLFGTKPTRVELLNKTAPGFFRIVQDSLWEGTILHIARLTDPPKSVGKPNLTIRALIGLISDPELAKRVSDLIQEAVNTTEFCRDWRNRHIAHRDLALAISTGAEPLKSATREKVKMACDRIADVLNALSLRYMETTTFFDTADPPGGATALLYVLDKGIKTKEEQRERMRRGEVRGGDFSPGDL
jgi:hypothetical protein